MNALTNRSYELAWTDHIDDNEESFRWIGTHKSPKGSLRESGAGIITYINYRASLSFTHSNNCIIVINFYENNFSNIINGINSTHSSLVILTEGGEPISENGIALPDFNGILTDKGVFDAPDGYFSCKIDNVKYFISYATSENYRWKYLSLIPYDIMFKSLQTVKNLMITICVIIWLLTATAAFQIGYEQYKPLREIMRLTDELLALESFPQMTHEGYSRIIDTLRFAISEIEKHKTKLHENLAVIKMLEESNSKLTRILEQKQNSFSLPPQAVDESKHSEISSRIKNYVRGNISGDVSIERLAKELHYNKAYLRKLFKDSEAISFSDFVNQVKLETAEEMLLKSNLKIEEVAAKLDYCASFYFIKKFKEHKGVTPKEFRARALL